MNDDVDGDDDGGDDDAGDDENGGEQDDVYDDYYSHGYGDGKTTTPASTTITAATHLLGLSQGRLDALLGLHAAFELFRATNMKMIDELDQLNSSTKQF